MKKESKVDFSKEALPLYKTKDEWVKDFPEQYAESAGKFWDEHQVKEEKKK